MPAHRVNRIKLRVLTEAMIFVTAIAILDWRVDLNVAFGFLYLFPILLLGTVFSVSHVLVAALVCTVLADWLDPFPFSIAILPQDLLVFTSLLGAGLLSTQVAKRRREEVENLKRVENEASARREVEEQFEFLVDSSPAAILTMNRSGDILLANPAAHRLLGISDTTLAGRNINRYIPALGRVTSTKDNL